MNGTRVYGIAAAECRDNVNELLKIAGLDDSRCSLIRDEHGNDTFFHSVGGVTYHKKIFSEQDCENAKQLRCWNFARVPFLYAEAELADGTDHPNAKSAAEFIKFCQRPDIPVKVGFSIDGGIIQRQDERGNATEDKESGKILARTLATSIALTVRPCNPKCVLFLENDLTKSDMTMAPPARFFDALKKSQATTSINEIGGDYLAMLLNLEKLKKSISDYFSAHADLKCNQCSKPTRFFKSSKNVPNRCDSCGSTYSMSQLWKALNK